MSDAEQEYVEEIKRSLEKLGATNIKVEEISKYVAETKVTKIPAARWINYMRDWMEVTGVAKGLADEDHYYLLGTHRGVRKEYKADRIGWRSANIWERAEVDGVWQWTDAMELLDNMEMED